MCNRSHRNFAHVTTVTLSWRVQNFIVIVRAHFKTEDGKLWSNFDFDRNIVSGTGTRTDKQYMLGIVSLCRVARFNLHALLSKLHYMPRRWSPCNTFIRLRSTKRTKLRIISLCKGNSLVTCEFLAQRYSNAENVSIWWRHHESQSICHHSVSFSV